MGQRQFAFAGEVHQRLQAEQVQQLKVPREKQMEQVSRRQKVIIMTVFSSEATRQRTIAKGGDLHRDLTHFKTHIGTLWHRSA